MNTSRYVHFSLILTNFVNTENDWTFIKISLVSIKRDDIRMTFNNHFTDHNAIPNAFKQDLKLQLDTFPLLNILT